MRRSSKHQQEEPMEFDDFRGGVNVLDPAHKIAGNELVKGINVEIDVESGRLQSRPRLGTEVAVFPDPVRKVWIHPEGYILVVAGRKLYFTHIANKLPDSFMIYGDTETIYGDVTSIWDGDYEYSIKELGELTGISTANFHYWDSKTYVASGGKLQVLDSSLKTLDKSPDCDIVYSRFGRLVVSKDGQDYIKHSSIGDSDSDEAWVEDSNNPLQAQELEVAYKEAGDIMTVVPLMSELAVFRTYGIYRVISEFPDWNVVEVTKEHTAVNRECAVQLGNTAVFLSKNGLKELAGVQSFGDIQQQDIAVKINDWLASRIDPTTAWIRHLKSRKQLIIKPFESPWVLVFHYQYAAAAMWKFDAPIADIAEWNGGVLAAQSNKLYWMQRVHTADNTTPVKAEILLKKFQGFNDFLVKRLAVSCENKKPGDITVSVSNADFTFALADNWDRIRGDTSLIHGDTSLIWEDTQEDNDEKNTVRDKYLQLGVTSSADFILNNIRIETAVIGNG